MFIFDEEVLDKLKTLKDNDEAYKFLSSINNVNDYDDYMHFYIASRYFKNNDCKNCSFLEKIKNVPYVKFRFNKYNDRYLSDFKVAQDIIRYAIRRNNLKILDIIDYHMYKMFFHEDKKELDSLFVMDGIYFCKYTYKKILEFDDEYEEEHKERYINPLFYQNRSLKWFYENFDLIKHISPQEMSMKNKILDDIKEVFDNHEFVEFVCKINFEIVLNNAHNNGVNIKDCLNC